MITPVSVVNIHHHTGTVFSPLINFKISSRGSLQIHIQYGLSIVTMLCVTSPGLTDFRTGSLYLLTPFTPCARPSTLLKNIYFNSCNTTLNFQSRKRDPTSFSIKTPPQSKPPVLYLHSLLSSLIRSLLSLSILMAFIPAHGSCTSPWAAAAFLALP